MSDAPTSAVDTLDLAAARAAGWSMAEIEWEVKCERAALLAEEGRPDEAAALWRKSLELARDDFSEDDPRLGTSLANAALALRQAGNGAAAAQLFAEAHRVWEASPQWIAEIALEPRARSSLFHLRMEARHRDKYDATMRERLSRFAEETREHLRALAEGRPSTWRGLARWRAEKPPTYGERRKFMAACLLLASARPSEDPAP